MVHIYGDPCLVYVCQLEIVCVLSWQATMGDVLSRAAGRSPSLIGHNCSGTATHGCVRACGRLRTTTKASGLLVHPKAPIHHRDARRDPRRGRFAFIPGTNIALPNYVPVPLLLEAEHHMRVGWQHGHTNTHLASWTQTHIYICMISIRCFRVGGSCRRVVDYDAPVSLA